MMLLGASSEVSCNLSKFNNGEASFGELNPKRLNNLSEVSDRKKREVNSKKYTEEMYPL